ncbi:MAG: hypothetical protein AAGB26_05210 [Planctomycetota bacterium]
MNVIYADDGSIDEPLWDSVAIRSCDFRPHFNGDLHNVFTTTHPLESKEQTEVLFKSISCEMMGWILARKKRFNKYDRFQIIVGWSLDVRDTARQCIKTGGSYGQLKELTSYPDRIELRDGWDFGIFMS